MLQLRLRILALELLLSVLTNPGPVFRNNDVFISLVKKDLCLPLSKSGISQNRTPRCTFAPLVTPTKVLTQAAGSG